MDPMWTAAIQETDRTLDPLAMSRMSGRITGRLLSGIITLTRRARYYSFYVWAIYDVNKKKINTYRQFRKAFYDRERAYMLACLLHQANSSGTRDHSAILGSIRGKRELSKSQKSIKMKFQFLANKLGGFGYYYNSSISNLGLTDVPESRIKYILTPLGKRVANAFEKSISKTTYFKRYKEKGEIPVSVLNEYGKECCLCNLPFKKALDRGPLREIMFGMVPNLKRKRDRQRRETLLLILYETHLVSKYLYPMDAEIFLDSAYFRQFQVDKRIVKSHYPKLFDDVLTKWKIFRAHDYFSYACESFLASFLRTLAKHDKTGLTFKGFINLVKEKPSAETLEKILLREFGSKDLNNIMVKDVIDCFGIETLNAEASEKFDAICRLSSAINEKRLVDKLVETFQERFELGCSMMFGFALLVLLYVRFYYLYKKVDKYWLWLFKIQREGDRPTDLTLTKFVPALEKKLQQERFSITDFLRWFMKEYVINQAKEVYWEKSLATYGKPRSWFYVEGGVYRKERDYNPKFRSSRFESAFTIAKDLGLCKFNGRLTELTPDGIDMLRRFGVRV